MLVTLEVNDTRVSLAFGMVYVVRWCMMKNIVPIFFFLERIAIILELTKVLRNTM